MVKGFAPLTLKLFLILLLVVVGANLNVRNDLAGLFWHIIMCVTLCRLGLRIRDGLRQQLVGKQISTAS